MVLTKNTAEYTQKETKEPNWNTTHPPLLPPLKKKQLDTSSCIGSNGRTKKSYET